MKTLFGVFSIASLVTAGIIAAAEMSGSQPARAAIYTGGLAGGLIALSGIPFVLVLGRIGSNAQADAQFWMWWGIGFFVRLTLLMVLSQLLPKMCPGERFPASMSMIAVYLVGLLAEAFWLGNILLKSINAAGKRA